MTPTPAELQAKCRGVARVLDHVGESELSASFWSAVATCKALEDAGNPNFETETVDVVNALVMAIDATTLKTSDLFNRLKSASFDLLDVVGPYWHHLADRWAKRRTKLREMWQVPADAAKAFADSYEVHGGLSDTPAGYVRVYPEPASPEFVAALQQLSGEHPALRLMFIEAEAPDTVYAADVHDESVVDSMLSSYPSTVWRGTAHLDDGSEVSEFTVYTLNGQRIFRVPGTLAACNKGVLDVLVTGELIPRMATTSKTASVLRLTFSLRAVGNPEFKDFLRSMGGQPASPVSWDVPILQESDIEACFAAIRERFGYSVMLHQIVDTPKQNIWAFTNPEAQAVRMLSAPVVKRVKQGYAVRTAKTTDLGVQLARAIASGKLSSKERDLVETVAGACRVIAHVVVTDKKEFKTASDLTKMFPRARVDADAVKGVYAVAVSEDVVQLVTSDALAPQSTAFTEEEAAGPCDCKGSDCNCDDATSEEDWILNVSMGNPAEYHEGEGATVPSMFNSPAADQVIGPDLASGDIDGEPDLETPEASEVEEDRPFEDPADNGDGQAHAPDTITDQITEGLPEPIAQIIETLPVCETCTAPYGSNPACSACNAYYEQVTGEDVSEEPLVRGTPNVITNESVEAAVDDTDFKAVEHDVAAYLRSLPGVDVHDIQHFTDDAGKGITFTADLYDDAIGQLGMKAPQGGSVDSGLAVTVAHNEDDSFWVTVSSNDETTDHTMVIFENGKSRMTVKSKKPMRDEVAAEVMKFVIAHTSVSEPVEAESGTGQNNPAVSELNAAGTCESCDHEYGTNFDCDVCLAWEPGMKSAAPKAVHVKFGSFSKPSIPGDTAWASITIDGVPSGEIVRETDYEFVGMGRKFFVSAYEVQLNGLDIDVEKRFEVTDGQAKKSLAAAKDFVRKTVADAKNAPVTVDSDSTKVSSTKTAKTKRLIPYADAKKLPLVKLTQHADNVATAYKDEARSPFGVYGGSYDPEAVIRLLPGSRVVHSGPGRMIIEWPAKQKMAVVFKRSGNSAAMLVFAGDSTTATKTASKPARSIGYEKVKAMSEQELLTYADTVIRAYDNQSHNPLGGESDDISPLDVLPHDADILIETGNGPTWRAVIDYPNKRRMAVIYRMQGRHHPSMLYFAGDTKVPRKAAFADDVLGTFYKTVEALKKTPHISDVTIHKARNPGFGAATITVAPDSLDVFGLDPKKMNKGIVEVDVFAYDDGIANVQLNADGKTVVTHIDDGTSRITRKSPGVNSNLVDLATKITKPMSDVMVPKAAVAAAPGGSVQLDKVEKDKVNAEFRKRGFDGNLRFKSVGAALAAAQTILHGFGFEFDEVTSGHLFNKPDGTRSIDIAKSGEDAFSPVSVNNSSLFFQWGRYGDTQDVSVVAYLG